MAEIVSYPVDNVLYDAADVQTYMCTRTSGVFAGDLDYNVTCTGDDNNVTVGDGLAWMRMTRFTGMSHVHKGSGIYDAGLPDPTFPRIDAVVLQYKAGQPHAEIIIKHGIAQSSPMPPEVVRTASQYELHLFHIKRRVGATAIAQSDLIDLRTDESYCGIMYDDVTLKGTLGFLTQKEKGQANGVASLDSRGKVPNSQLPAMNYIPTSEKSQPYGVATLGWNGKVPSSQLPAAQAVDLEPYMLKSARGDANGVAPLVGGKVPSGYLPPAPSIPPIPDMSLKTISEETISNSDGDITFWGYKYGRLVVISYEASNKKSSQALYFSTYTLPAPAETTRHMIAFTSFTTDNLDGDKAGWQAYVEIGHNGGHGSIHFDFYLGKPVEGIRGQIVYIAAE